MSATLTAWCLAAALHHAPPVVGGPFGDATEADAIERRRSICADVVAVVTERPERPGYVTHRDRVALLLALGIGESRLARDVDVGIVSEGTERRCYHGPGHASRCDADRHGRDRSVSVWQVRVGGLHDGEPITAAALFADRRLAARIALRRALSSIHTCGRSGPAEDSLSAYGSGVCLVAPYRGDRAVRARWRSWLRLRGWVPAVAAKGPEKKGET